MKFKFHPFTLITSICSAALALLGFTGCDEAGGGGGLAMYGTPYGTFEIKGKVTSEDGSGVKDAKILVTDPHIDSNRFAITSTTTEANGEYKTEDSDYFPRDVKVVCHPEGDTLEADSTVVNLKYKGGKGGWDKGHADATVNFTLKKKKD